MKIMLAMADISEFDRFDFLYEAAYERLPEIRKNKADRLSCNADKRRCAAAGVLLNYLLRMWYEKDVNTKTLTAGEAEFISCYSSSDRNIKKECINIEMINLLEAVNNYDIFYNYEIVIKQNGKPVFADYPNIHFNISHSKRYVVCVLASVEVGIDIEGERTANTAVARRFFSEAEAEWAEGNERRFFRLWTLKEAFAKVTGEGIAKSIKKLHFKIDSKESAGLWSRQEHNGQLRIVNDIRRQNGSQSAQVYMERLVYDVSDIMTSGKIYEYEFAEYMFGEYCAALMWHKEVC